MLEIIHDNRTGNRLEIVIPTFNEEARVARIVSHYTRRFDVVVLDDDSTDTTVAQAIEAGGSVFRRTVKGIVAEAHFAYYTSELTRSGLCFWMHADEFISCERMEEIEVALREGASGVLCRRVNYFFAREVLTLTSVHPRGFVRNTARYQAEDLHGGVLLDPLPGRPVAPKVFKVHHLHAWSTRNYFGTAGTYVFLEVEKFLQDKHPAWCFFRRYVLSFGAFLLLKWWREKNLSGAGRLIIVMERLTILLLAAMSWLEQKHMPTFAQQKAYYDEFFVNDKTISTREDSDATQTVPETQE